MMDRRAFISGITTGLLVARLVLPRLEVVEVQLAVAWVLELEGLQVSE